MTAATEMNSKYFFPLLISKVMTILELFGASADHRQTKKKAAECHVTKLSFLKFIRRGVKNATSTPKTVECQILHNFFL